jgi:hypothetical protein
MADEEDQGHELNLKAWQSQQRRIARKGDLPAKTDLRQKTDAIMAEVEKLSHLPAAEDLQVRPLVSQRYAVGFEESGAALSGPEGRYAAGGLAVRGGRGAMAGGGAAEMVPLLQEVLRVLQDVKDILAKLNVGMA